jgi:hypothetical protein
MLRCLRRLVGVRQTLRAVRKQIAEFQLAEPRQRQVEAAELQFAELEAEDRDRAVAAWPASLRQAGS